MLGHNTTDLTGHTGGKANPNIIVQDVTLTSTITQRPTGGALSGSGEGGTGLGASDKIALGVGIGIGLPVQIPVGRTGMLLHV